MTPTDPSDELDELDEFDAFALKLERNPELERELEQQLSLRARDRPELPDELYDLYRDVQLLRDADDPSEPPYMFDRFEAFEAKIGGMGLVLGARDPELGRVVGIKLWKQSGAKANAALLAEARVLAKLSHPNVVTVYEVGRWNERVYFVMQWVEGQDGHEWMEERFDWLSIQATTQAFNEKLARRLAWQEVRRVFVAAGQGLAAAHAAGIQHRDFKPGNMLVGDDGRVYVADFGVADSLRAIEAQDEGEQSQRRVGTPTYMAPERLRGQPGDARSDQFSFCVALWKALHGYRPFAAETAEKLLPLIERGAILRKSIARDVPRWLAQVIRKGLADDPDQRYPNMDALVQALLDDPPDGDIVDVEPLGNAVAGATGRLLHAPETSGRVELALDSDKSMLLLRELVTLMASGERSKVEDVTVAPGGDRVAARQRSKRSLLLVAATSVVSALITALVLAAIWPPVPVAPTPALSAEDDSLDVILANIAANEFSEANKLWIAKRREGGSDERGLSDRDSVKIGRACFERAKELESIQPAKSGEAVDMAHQVARFAMIYSSELDTRKAAGELVDEILQYLGRRPPTTPH